MRGLAIRRHKQWQAKGRARRLLRLLFGRPEWVTPTAVGRRAVTPAPCSCSMCGNPRRYFGDVSRQEARAAPDTGH